MKSFTIFTSSVLPLSVTTRLGMQPEVASKVQQKLKQRNRLNQILFMHKMFSTFRLPVDCSGSYIKDEPNFPLQNTGNLISQTTVWSNKALNFEDFQDLVKKSSIFSRNLSKCQSFVRWHLKCTWPSQACTNDVWMLLT